MRYLEHITHTHPTLYSSSYRPLGNQNRLTFKAMPLFLSGDDYIIIQPCATKAEKAPAKSHTNISTSESRIVPPQMTSEPQVIPRRSRISTMPKRLNGDHYDKCAHDSGFGVLHISYAIDRIISPVKRRLSESEKQPTMLLL